MVDTVFVDMARDGDQVGKHRVADGSGHLGIGQRIQADVDDAAFADDLQPVEDRPWIVEVGVVGGEQLCGLAAGEFFQEWQQ
ncbi:hypothetical protein D3C81_764830 [compost metagenome]